METKQTAVEWFAQEAILLHFNHATKTLPTKVFEVAYMQLINKAKQMEKEQIKDFFNFGIGYDGLIDDCNSIFNDYYNETYGK
jgi:hypothetical protein